MKKHRQLLALLICLVMSVSLLTGYSETKAATEEPAQSGEQDATQETAETREITDMAGRKVTVPVAENIESVFSAGPVAAIFLYMVAPDKLLGWNYELNDVEKSIILDKYQDLPNFGMGDAVNYEAVIAANPTIAINSGKINDTMVSDCDALSESLGIPVVAVDNELNNSAEAFRFMGELLGVEDHAEELAQYAEQVFTDINALSDIPEEKKSVYTSVMERIHWKLHPGDPSMHRSLMPSMQSMLQIWNWEMDLVFRFQQNSFLHGIRM